MTVKARLILLALLGAAGMLIIGSAALFKLSTFNQGMAESFEQVKAGEGALVSVGRAQAAFKTQVQEWKNILIRGNDRASFERHLKGFEREEALVARELSAVAPYVRQTLPGTDVAALIADHRQMGERYRQALGKFDANDPDSGKAIDQAVRGLDRTFADGLDKLLAAIQQKESEMLANTLSAAEDDYTMLRNALIAVVAALVVGIGLMTSLMVRRIVHALSALSGTMSRAARERDLRVRAEVTGNDEIAAAAHGLNGMLEAFQQLVQELRSQAEGVAGNSSDVARAMGEIDSSVSVLNDSTSTVAASIEELTVSINQVRDNAEQTLAITRESSNLASEGGEVMSRTVGRMLETAERVQAAALNIERLGEQSSAISGIVQVIREVADQTNLLALNAAIEAARAGEQGRGFAVVADEVRKLAERTASATHEISDKIGTVQQQAARAVQDMQFMVTEVNQDAELAREAGTVIERIQQGAQRVVDVAGDITSALREQAVASDTIARQLETIARSSDESTAALGQTTESIRNLESMATGMRSAAARFNV